MVTSCWSPSKIEGVGFSPGADDDAETTSYSKTERPAVEREFETDFRLRVVCGSAASLRDDLVIRKTVSSFPRAKGYSSSDD